jgi:hypothetical protein
MTEAVARAVFELAEKVATRMRQRACWQIRLSTSPASWLGGHQRAGTITMGGAWY